LNLDALALKNFSEVLKLGLSQSNSSLVGLTNWVVKISRVMGALKF
jgi:hypothetical protein